jgi:hypothetical protein
MVDKRTTMGVLILVCPKTAAEIDTLTVYTHGDLERAKGAQLLLFCPGCGKVHIFNFSDGQLRAPRQKDGHSAAR